MKLKNLNFGGYVFGQSGVQGFFGKGDEYPHHSFYRYIPGFSFKGISFVAKTVTLEPRIYPDSSNTELRQGYKVKRLLPASVWCSVRSFMKGYLLNAIGLANPGLKKMLLYGKWQQRLDTFQISVMLMETTLEAKLVEAKEICKLLKLYMLPGNIFPYALQINFSCPNTGHEQVQAENDIIEILKVFGNEFPWITLIPKFDLLVSPETVSRLSSYCDAFCIANTLPFGKKEPTVWWRKLFKKELSPLTKHFGGKFAGGLSGAPLFPLLVDWLIAMNRYDNKVKIIAGGGIMNKKNIDVLAAFPIVHGVALGSVAILRPWRLQSLIKHGNYVFAAR